MTGCDDAALIEAMRGAAKVGIDAPFGWPRPFVEAIVAHQRGGAWPGRGLAQAKDFRRTLRLRATDAHVHAEVGITPLSVSSDMIGVVAMRCALLLDAAAAAGVAVQRDGVHGQVCEVYPAAALRRWGLPWKGYKRVGGAAIRATIVDRLDADPGVRERLTESDHALDAYVSALIARDVHEGRTAPPPPELADLAAEEGWIHIPR
jgi:hypothetical protein